MTVQEARCGLCGARIARYRSEGERVVWCHTEVPAIGHAALYVDSDEPDLPDADPAAGE